MIPDVGERADQVGREKCGWIRVGPQGACRGRDKLGVNTRIKFFEHEDQRGFR